MKPESLWTEKENGEFRNNKLYQVVSMTQLIRAHFTWEAQSGGGGGGVSQTPSGFHVESSLLSQTHLIVCFAEHHHL